MHGWYNLNKKKEYYEKYKDILIVGMNEEELKDIKKDGYMKKIKEDIENLNKDESFFQLFTDEEDHEIMMRSIYS